MKKLLVLLTLSLTLLMGSVHINSATKAELMTLKGIGEKTALSIINYRSKHPFRSLLELQKIKGIGTKKFEKIKADIEL